MAGTSRSAPVSAQFEVQAWGRGDTVLFALVATTLVLLAIPVEPLLGDAGTKVPVVGALHALNGLLICALAGWLMAETGRRRAAARRTAGSGGGGDRR
jgi:hypothetical protein